MLIIPNMALTLVNKLGFTNSMLKVIDNIYQYV